MRRILDWAFYPGILCLAAAVAQQLFVPAHGWLWWPLVIAGVVLVAASLVPRLLDSREALGTRTVRFGVNTAIAIVLVLGIATLVEALSYRHNARLDLTENRRHSLSPQTIQILQKLEQPVQAVAFYRADQPNKRVAEDLFKQYARHSNGKFTWRSVDPDREPTLARGYGVEAYGTTVLESKGRTEKVLDAEQEEKLTNALVRVTREGKRVVYFLQGHGERDLASSEPQGYSQVKEALERANYEVKTLALARDAKVPDDAAVVVIGGPRTDYFPPEIDALDAYLGRGGKLLVMTDPPVARRGEAPAVQKLLGRWGIELRDDLVIEVNPIGQLFGIGPQVPLVQQYEPHPITRDMGGLTTLFPLTRSVVAAQKPPAGVSVRPLAQTTRDAWGETDRQALERGQARPDPQDTRGPLALALVATRDKARVVAFGTSEVPSNQYLNVQGNRDFFLNTVAWLAEEEDLISIRPKDTRTTPVFLTSRQAQAVFWLPVVFLPAVGLVGGVVAVVRRRRAA